MITSKLRIWLIIVMIVTIIPNISLSERISTKKCKEYEAAVQKVNYFMPLLGMKSRTTVTDKCQHKSIPLIVGGVAAKKYEFPHQALLGYDAGREIQWNCGGSLISSNFVLTAAHCSRHSKHKEVKYVKLGMNSRSQADDKVFVYGISEIYSHSGYTRKLLINDIALLKLNDTVKFTEYLYPACLPTSQPNIEKAIITGFGTTGRFEDSSEVLMKVFVEKFPHAECQNVLRSIRIDQNSMICFGNKTHPGDACRGDSGGPIQVGNDKEVNCTYKLIGVVSFGALDCGTPGVPSVFANVFNFIDWIESIVWPGEA